MNALDLKLLRDLWRFRASVFGICLVLAVATWTFVLANGAYRSLDSTRTAYYERNNFGDVFAQMTRAPRSIVQQVKHIKGVRAAEGSIHQYATLDLAGRSEPIRALLTSLGDNQRSTLNRVTIRRGRLPRAGHASEVVVDEAFADANDLGPGDHIAAIVYGRRLELDIVGIGLSPEFIYTLGPGDFLPDSERFGIFWMNRTALEAATDRIGAINYLTLKLESSVPEADVVREVDVLIDKYGGTGAHGRKNHLSHAFLSNELNQLEALTKVIPPVFLLVAAFLVYVVLGRLVRTERTQIGLLKAIGYSDWAIGFHYIKFALVIAAAGSIMGSIAGVVIGRNVTSIYADLYSFPFLQYELPPDVFLVAVLLAIISAGLGAIGGVRIAIKLVPAVAMAPPPPPVYSAGPAETVGRSIGLSPIGQMVLRHVLRWPMRSAMTIVGVALSIGLTFATMQFVDSAREMINSSFVREQRQDMTVMFVEPRNDDVIRELAQIPGVLRAEPLRRGYVKLRHGHREERTIIDGLSSEGELSVRVHGNQGIAPLPQRGLMISQRLADKLDVVVGDTVEVEQLGGRQTQLRLEVSSVVDEFVAARSYVSDETMDLITRDASPADSAMLVVDHNKREEILKKLKEMPRVMGVVEANASIRKFEELINNNIMTLINIFTVFAAAVSAGVVYNSARIIFAERTQEFATLRVLGYLREEVALVLVGELALLVAVAVPLGCVIGYFLGDYMTGMVSSDLFRLPFAPARSTYAHAVIVCLVATVFSVFVVARRIYQIDPVYDLRQAA